MRLRRLPPGHDPKILPAVWSGRTARCAVRVRFDEIEVVQNALHACAGKGVGRNLGCLDPIFRGNQKAGGLAK